MGFQLFVHPRLDFYGREEIFDDLEENRKILFQKFRNIRVHNRLNQDDFFLIFFFSSP
jgi:hypothetical protein